MGNETSEVFNIRKSLKLQKKTKEKQKLNEIDAMDEVKEDFVDKLKKWWSNEVELEQYFDKCIDAGYENIKYIEALHGDQTKMDTFVQAIGIEKEGHIMMVKEALIALHERMEKLEQAKQQKLNEQKQHEEEMKKFKEDVQENEYESDDGELTESKFLKWKKMRGIQKKKKDDSDDSSAFGLVNKLN